LFVIIRDIDFGGAVKLAIAAVDTRDGVTGAEPCDWDWSSVSRSASTCGSS
jgi:hypothetical protein